jgi:ABC-type uncharacterized transport system substrate-binding protein
MRRRKFITLVGGVVVVSILRAEAQQSMPVIGWLNSGPSNDPYFMSFATAFRAGLKDAGYVEGQNVAIDFRWGEGQYNRLPTLAAELVANHVDVIVAGGPLRLWQPKLRHKPSLSSLRLALIQSVWVLSTA